LKLRLANLEAPQGVTSTPTKEAAPGKGWAVQGKLIFGTKP
jgi:hypothetical protein